MSAAKIMDDRVHLYIHYCLIENGWLIVIISRYLKSSASNNMHDSRVEIQSKFICLEQIELDKWIYSYPRKTEPQICEIH